MSKITYADKQTLNENTSIADINKVKASDLNEIKTVVNQNDDNTTTNTTEINTVKSDIETIETNISTINTNIGDLNNLETTDKSSVVNSINEINNRFTYSTDEQIIGKWINGKPLYKKVVLFNDTINADEIFSKPHGIDNVDVAFIKNAYLYVPASGLCYPLNQVGYNGNLTEKFYCWSDRTNVYIYGNSGANQNWGKLFILEYTKTTD